MITPKTQSDWIARQAALVLDARPFINGQRNDAKTDATFNALNVTKGETLATLPDCGPEDVDSAVAAARAAFASGIWSKLAPSARGKILRRFGELVTQHGDTLALLDSLQMGMPIGTSSVMAPGAADILVDFADLAEQQANILMPSAPNALIAQVRRARGVVAAITPWNFPLHIALSKIAPALAAGNSVILKPSEIAPLGCLMLADLALEAGLPPGVLNVLPGTGALTGRLLALHRDVDCLTFTGSTATGLKLLEYAGRSNMKQLLLECGGKSPQIVFDDAGDLDGLADALFGGFSWNSGQVCTNGARILIAKKLYPDLVARLIKRVEASTTGDTMDPDTSIGPLAGPAQYARVTSLLASVDASDQLLASGQVLGGQLFGVAPRLYAASDPNSKLVQTEIFGPVASVMPFRDEHEAITLANGTLYGLSANIWARDVGVAHRVVQDLRAGFVSINAVANPGSADSRFYSGEPFGMSGFGADGGLPGLLSYTRLQSVNYLFS
jgi:acyl-CoA reductase-like NAD-dependent aldehyde dehydrogenase